MGETERRTKKNKPLKAPKGFHLIMHLHGFVYRSKVKKTFVYVELIGECSSRDYFRL